MGDDTLDGGAGVDSLTGDRGNDTLQGGPDTDSIDGGSGDDQCEPESGSTNCELELPSGEPARTVYTRGYDGDGLLTEVAVTHPDGTVDVYGLTWDKTLPVPQVVSYTLNGVSTSVVYGMNRALSVDAAGIASGFEYSVLGDVTGGFASVSTGFDPYGDPENTQVDVGFGYRGELHVGGMVYLRFRDLNPTLGRFTTVDPLSGVPGTTTVANQYAYAGNDSVGMLDPWGLRATDGGFGVVEPVTVFDLIAQRFFADPQADYVLRRTQTYGFAWELLAGRRVPSGAPEAAVEAAGVASAFLRELGYRLDGVAGSSVYSAETALADLDSAQVGTVIAIATELVVTYESNFATALLFGALDNQLTYSFALNFRQFRNLRNYALATATQQTSPQLLAAADRAVATTGPGSGPVYGTRVHSAFADEIAALGRADLFTEVSYLHGRVVPYGTPGSVRLDVVEGSVLAPRAIYDLKTGTAALTPGRISQIRSHLPDGFENIPILEVRPSVP